MCGPTVPVRQIQSQMQVPGLPLRIFMLLAWVSLTVFMLGLPLWSYLFNDVFGFGAILCTGDPQSTQCGNGVDYVQVAEQLGRTNAEGVAWACTCEQGVFADFACETTNTPYFSVSFYVSTAPGTGAMALFSAFPILFIWFFGAGNMNTMAPLLRADRLEDKQREIDIVTITQVVFQVFFGMFQFASVCVFPTFHIIVVLLFINAEVIHFLAIARGVGTSTVQGKIIVALTVFGVLALVLGPGISLVGTMLRPDTASSFERHAFYLGEAAGFSVISSIPVVLVWGAALAPSVKEGEGAVQPLTTA